ncbi:hypothetical protein [Neisseria sicca]
MFQTTSGSSEILWCGDMVQYRAKVCQYVDHPQCRSGCHIPVNTVMQQNNSMGFRK